MPAVDAPDGGRGNGKDFLVVQCFKHVGEDDEPRAARTAREDRVAVAPAARALCSADFSLGVTEFGEKPL